MHNTTAVPLIGKLISQYDIVAKIGGGGMGVVYKATDTKLGRTVALKFLPPEWSHDEAAKQRFLREAQAASATNHRNICVIHDIDQTEDGRLFIVMAYYEGQTLKQKLEQGAVPLADAIEIATEAAEGLAKAHAHGIVHRDVKPGNLMITDDGVKVLDFGLAKFADALQLTIPGSTIGTVAYMSPEQVRGEEADARSDVWALGVVMYQMLTGEVPFKGAYAEAIFYAIKHEPVPPLGATGSAVTEPLEAIVVRALEKDPEKRYQSARELARDLRLVQGRSVPLELRTGPLPPFAPGHAPRSPSISRGLRGAVTPRRATAAALAVLLAGAASYRWLTRPIVRVPVAIAPVSNHTGEPELDAYRLALTEMLVEELGESPNIRVLPYLPLVEIVRPFVGGGDVSGSEAIQAIATESGARVLVMPSLEYRNDRRTWLARAEIRSAATGATTNTYETEEVTSSLPKDAAYRATTLLVDQVQRHFKTNGPGLSYKRRLAAAHFRNIEAARAFEDGLNQYEQLEYAAALASFRRAAAEDDQHAMTHAWASRVLLILRQGNEAVASAKRARQLVTVDTPRADAAFIEAILAESQADFRGADEQYRRLTAMAPDDPAGDAELADFLKRQYRNQEAVETYHHLLRVDARYIRPHVDLCQLYNRLPDRPLAEQHARIALESYRGAKNRPGEAQALLCLGDLQRAQGNLADARRTIEGARDIFQSLGMQFGLSRVYQYLGVVAGDAGNLADSVRFFEESLSRSRQIGSRDMEALELMNLGLSHERQGRRAQALEYYQQSRDLYEQNGDERRAAEQEINAASLLVEAGARQVEALRRAANARATLRKQGSLEFEMIAMQTEAASHLYAGRHAEARRELHMALSLAKERQLDKRFVWLTVKLAESYLMTGEYEGARPLLEQAEALDAGRDDPEVAIALGKLLVRLGDPGSARGRLTRALTDIEASAYLMFAPLAHLALGELEYESGKPNEARAHFEKAARFWSDDLPDAATVEATCYGGLLDALAGKSSGGRGMLEKGLRQARTMGRLSLEAQCRMQLARIEVGERRYEEAIARLNQIPSDSDRSIGGELEAAVHYWRGRALLGRHDVSGAAPEFALARKLAQDIQAALPNQYRDRFSSRRDIRPIIEEHPVRESP